MGESRTRFALGTVLALAAVAAVAMYVSQDGGEVAEDIKSSYSSYSHSSYSIRTTTRTTHRTHPDISKFSLKTLLGSKSVKSLDILKAGSIITETPDGRMLMSKYLQKIEDNIHTEVSRRKEEVSKVRAKMARDLAFNRAARSKIKKRLLHRMAVNQKKLQKRLAKFMRSAHERFAKMAELRNRRQKNTLRRDARTMAQVRKNKRIAAHRLRMAVLAQQRATAAFAANANAKINQANKHVAANAALIKENARAARRALMKTQHHWQGKINNFRRLAAQRRSKIALQWSIMNKKTRLMANNKVQALVSSTAARFQSVELGLAKARHRVDMAVKAAAKRLFASLMAQKALNDRRYAQTVKNIATARREANNNLKNAKSEFKVSSLVLMDTVKHQVAKVNRRINGVAGVVQRNRVEQAKVNRNVNAELKRMTKLGDERETELLKRNHDLRRIAKRNKRRNMRAMQRMSSRFQARISHMRKVMRKDRRFQESQLKRKTAALYVAMANQKAKMAKANAKQAAYTRRMKLDAWAAMRRMKHNFMKRYNQLGKKVAKDQHRFQGKLDNLTGVVRRNAIKNARGRAQIKQMAAAQHRFLRSVLRTSVAKGEARAKKMDSALTKMNKDTRTIISLKLGQEIQHLAKSAKRDIDSLSLENKKARAMLRKQMLYAVKSANAVAKQQLKQTVVSVNKQFVNLAKESAAQARRAGANRAAIAKKLKRSQKRLRRQLYDAVSNQNRALLAYKTCTSKAIKKTNRRITAAARQLNKNTRVAKAQMTAMVNTITNKISAARNEARIVAATVNSKDLRRHSFALKFTQAGLAKAVKRSNQHFSKLYTKLGKDRKRSEQALNSAVVQLNMGIAAQAALEDRRFAKTVKNLNKARKAAAAAVTKARRAFTISMADTRAFAKNVETRLQGEIAVVSAEVMSNRIFQARVNRNVKGNMKRVINISNNRHTAAIRARASIRRVMNENKRLAARTVKTLARSTDRKINALHRQMARGKAAYQKALTRSTIKLYAQMSANRKLQEKANSAISAQTRASVAVSAAAVRSAKKEFASKLTSLSNVVVSHAHKYKARLNRMSGTIKSMIRKNASDRRLAKKTNKAMAANLQRNLVRAMQLGEARMRAAEQRVQMRKKKMIKAVSAELSAATERMADNVFRTMKGRRQHIASNYLNLKGYCAAKRATLISQVAGHKISSIGDLLLTVAYISKVSPKKERGMAMGNGKITQLFSGKKIKMKNVISRVNGLTNEYTRLAAQVRTRWPFGMGKYLLDQADKAMQNKGVLEVKSISGRSGKFVFINANSVGLSSEVAAFKKLAVRITKYSSALVQLTQKVSKKPIKTLQAKKITVKPPEWQGD